MAAHFLTFNAPTPSIALVAEERSARGVIRYETIVATLVGVCALAVSGYTAYVQRQQVRAAVWPILEFGSSNEPDIHLTLANKGVGPAIIRHVVVKVDGQPVKNWSAAVAKMLGPGKHHFFESDMSNHVFAAGEDLTIFTPLDAAERPLPFNRNDPSWAEMNKDRFRVAVEICYSSTLGECWTLRSDAYTSSTTETRPCPTPSARTFEQ
jgi:hypothetical protein